MTELPYKKGDPANTGFQYLEDLATGYWYSEVLFTAIELNIFDHLEKDIKTIEELASILYCDADNLKRLLKAMESLALVINVNDEWFNSQIASRYLISSSNEYMGHFILYRKYMMKQWQALTCKIRGEEEQLLQCNEDDLEDRFFKYLRATDSQIKLKGPEILEILNRYEWRFPVLDIGGGAGSFLRSIIGSDIKEPEKRRVKDTARSTLFELDDVIRAAKRLYPAVSDWKQFKTLSGDFRSHLFGPDDKYGLIIMSNFLHAYGATEARELFKKACGLLDTRGVLLVHDYFPDRIAIFPQKGILYDLNMLVNTYNGRCHESREIIRWIQEENTVFSKAVDLKSDTSVIIAHSKGYHTSESEETAHNTIHERVQYRAFEMGFRQAIIIPVNKIITASWTVAKCRFGCEKYNKNIKCPPNGLDQIRTNELLSGYSYAIILEGTPPGKDFHNKLLELEKSAFYHGLYKAFTFIAGPCSICPECPESGECRNPKLARPSMEGSGIDVYATCRTAGISISPVLNKGDYVKYIGLLLLE